MNIIYDHQIFTAQMYGGVSRYFYEISSRLNLNHDVHTEILAPLYQNHYIKSARGVIVKGHHVINFSKTAGLFSSINQAISNMMLYSENKFDIIHETYYNYPTIKPRNSASITTVHDMIHELFPGEFGANNQTLINKKKSILASDHIICVSQNTKNDLLRFYDIPEDKVSVIHLGSSLHENQIFIEKNTNSKPFFLFVGRRQGYKNFISLAKAIAESSRLKNTFSIVCFGGGPLTNTEMQILKEIKFPLEEIVCKNGDDYMLGWYYRNAAALVIPSHYEGFGIPLLEAMSIGCPIACSRAGSLPEIAGEAATYFNPLEIGSIVDCLENIIFKQDLARDLIRAGNARIKNYSWDKCAEQTLTAYKTMA